MSPRADPTRPRGVENHDERLRALGQLEALVFAPVSRREGRVDIETLQNATETLRCNIEQPGAVAGVENEEVAALPSHQGLVVENVSRRASRTKRPAYVPRPWDAWGWSGDHDSIMPFLAENRSTFVFRSHDDRFPGLLPRWCPRFHKVERRVIRVD